MINGIVVGLVIDNVDPDKLGRVKVKFPVDGETPPESSWVRAISPMAGKLRGWVSIPDIGTEVVVGFAYRTMSPYILGAVYNGGDDKPGPYANEDGNDDHRRFWSRNSHWIDFDDTAGAERIEIKSTSESEAIVQEFHAAKKVITQKVQKHCIHEAKQTVSLACKTFTVEASMGVSMTAGQSSTYKASASAKIESGTLTCKASSVSINGGGGGSAQSAVSTPAHKHPPTKP